VATTSSCRGETACPPGSRNGTGLAATHPPRIWILPPSDSLGGPVTARGHARLKPTWFPPKVVPVTPPAALTDIRSRHWASGPSLTRPPADSTHGRHNPRCARQAKPIFQMSWRRTQQVKQHSWSTTSQQRQELRAKPAQGTWCESHTMAPAVCILNPFNGTHTCRPGGGLRWGRSPTAAHRSKHSLARSSKLCYRAAPEGASSAAHIPCTYWYIAQYTRYNSE
jgi:hypothetical protein